MPQRLRRLLRRLVRMVSQRPRSHPPPHLRRRHDAALPSLSRCSQTPLLCCSPSPATSTSRAMP
eukprot:4178393-Pleurochrysis_carterae.AAC.1